MENLKAVTTIEFNAPAAKVWEGLTSPAMVKQYFFGTDLEADWRVGGHITFSGEWEGHKYRDSGIIKAIHAPNYLKYSYWSSMSGTEDKPENYNDITYELTEDNGATMLVITQEGVKNQEAVEHSQHNWQSVFEGLKKMIE